MRMNAICEHLSVEIARNYVHYLLSVNYYLLFTKYLVGEN